MQRFMFIVREDLKKIGQLTDEERLSNVPPPLEWIRSLAESGNYITGEPLAIKGRYVSKEDVLSDGPFIEAKEDISGYDIIMAENFEQAVAIAQSNPLLRRELPSLRSGRLCLRRKMSLPKDIERKMDILRDMWKPETEHPFHFATKALRHKVSQRISS